MIRGFRRFAGVAASILLLQGSLVPFPLQGQSSGTRWALEVGGGVAFSSSLVTSRVAIPREEGARVEELSLRPSPGPAVALAVGREVAPGWWGELRGGLTRSVVRGDGPGGGWEVGTLTSLFGAVGFRGEFRPWLHGRVAAGYLHPAGSGLALLEEGGETGVLGVVALSTPVPGVPLPLRVEAEFQRHAFGTPRIRQAGGSDGGVARWIVSLVWRAGGGG